MPRIPTFQTQTVASGSVSPGPSGGAIDFSGLARGFDRLHVGLAQQQADAEREARLQEQQREAADRAAAREHYLSLKDAIADDYDEFGSGILDGTVDKTSARTKWAERAKERIDSSIEKVPPSQRSHVQSLLTADSARFERLVGRTVRKKDQTDTLGAIDATLEYAARLAQSDPDAARLLAMQTLAESGPAAGLNAAQLQARANAWREEAAYTRALGELTRGKGDNKMIAQAEQAINGMPDLDPRRKVELLDRAANYRAANEQRAEIEANRRERERERVLRKAEHEFNAFQTLADKGGALQPEYVDQVVKATAGTPYQAAVRGVADQVRAVGGMASRPIAEQRSALAAIDAKIAQSGRTPALDKQREQIAKVLSASETDAKGNPLAAYAERGGGAAPALDFSSFDTLLPGLQARSEHATTVGRWAGSAVSPFDGSEAARVADKLSALPVEQRGARIAQLSGAMTAQQAQALARQMDPKDRALALEFAAGASRTDSGKHVAEWIARGSQAMKDKAIKEDNAAMTGLRARISEEVGDALSGKLREDVIDAARLAYLGQQAAGLSPSPKGVVALALGGTLVEHNGKRIPVPAGVDDLRGRLEHYPVRSIAAQAPDGFVYLPGGRPMGVPEFLGALPDAQLEPAGNGRYFVRSGGSIAMNQDRRPIVVEVR